MPGTPNALENIGYECGSNLCQGVQGLRDCIHNEHHPGAYFCSAQRLNVQKHLASIGASAVAGPIAWRCVKVKFASNQTSRWSCWGVNSSARTPSARVSTLYFTKFTILPYVLFLLMLGTLFASDFSAACAGRNQSPRERPWAAGRMLSWGWWHIL